MGTRVKRVVPGRRPYQPAVGLPRHRASTVSWTGPCPSGDRRLERSLSVPGSLVWNEMKENAEAIATRTSGGLPRLYRAGVDKGTLTPRHVRLHLIGHSAGSIVLSHAAKALIAESWEISTVTLMAPPVRCDAFEATTHSAFDEDRRTREPVIAGLAASRKGRAGRTLRPAARRQTQAGRR